LDRLKKNAVLTRFIGALRESDSWAGETHIQKSTYFLQELLNVPLGFRYVLYWYGPFSFDLRDELTGLRGDGLLSLHPQWPYGARYLPTKQAENVQALYAKTLHEYADRIEFVADSLGNKAVKELERLATGYYITRKIEDGSAEERAEELVKIKPHISMEDAIDAIHRVDEIIEQAQALLH
jgi:uncharacterized protein YwgA